MTTLVPYVTTPSYRFLVSHPFINSNLIKSIEYAEETDFIKAVIITRYMEASEKFVDALFPTWRFEKGYNIRLQYFDATGDINDELWFLDIRWGVIQLKNLNIHSETPIEIQYCFEVSSISSKL